MTKAMNEALTYGLAIKHLCRTSCVVPAVVLKVAECTRGVFQSESCAIESLHSA